MRSADLLVAAELSPLEAHDVHERTFGLGAVTNEEARVHSLLSAGQIQANIALGATVDIDAAEYAADVLLDESDAGERQVGPELALVRTNLARLSSEQYDMLDDYMETNVPPSFRAWKGEPIHKGTRWAEWLHSGADDKQLLNVLQWHTHVIESQQQSKEVQRKLKAEQLVYRENLSYGAAEGWLGDGANEAQKKVDDVRVYIGDIFSTTLMHKGGYHPVGTNQIVVAQGFDIAKGYADVRHSIDAAYGHEMNHVVLFTGEYDDDPNRDENAPVDPLGVRWINEALTQHIEEVMNYGDPHTVRLDKRKGSTTYPGERTLLAVLLDKGSVLIDPALATRAYSGSSQQRQEFFDALDESWGIENVLGKINDVVQEYETVLQNTYSSERESQIQALHAMVGRLSKHPKAVFGDDYRLPQPYGVAA